ncbi:MAG TPA: peptidoglycan DD-metalloendopeptidase family protein [Gaiellaceae bacterium]|nr:peptidoglycan DD-metalloendopeptidase family protein [Gaiellaceae bacterium]
MRESGASAFRWTAVAVAAIAVAATVGGAARAEDRRHGLQHRLADTKERIAEARQREHSITDQVTAVSDRIEGVEGELDRASGELAALESRLEAARSRLRELERRLAEKTTQLRLARGQLAEAERRLHRRLVDIYTAGDTDPLAVILGAESLQDLVDRVEAQDALLEHDSSLVGWVTALQARVASERRRTRELRLRQAQQTGVLARETDERRAVVERLAAQRQSLAALRATRARSLASVRVERQEWEEEAAALEAESAQIASIIAAAPPAPAPSGEPAPAPPPAGSGFAWPVRGPVVSPYGMRWGRLHAGVDIAAPAGTPIIASASGQVIYSGSMSGYGNIVVVQHAGGTATAYAHNSANYVAVGQTLSQGQRIAAVGCTGRCFGNHVHFEVRVNGTPVDPMGYL